LDKSNVGILDNGGRLSLSINVNTITALVDDSSNEPEYITIGFSGDIAKTLFGKYYP
jgi:hypothetical protein